MTCLNLKAKHLRMAIQRGNTADAGLIADLQGVIAGIGFAGLTSGAIMGKSKVSPNAGDNPPSETRSG